MLEIYIIIHVMIMIAPTLLSVRRRELKGMKRKRWKIKNGDADVSIGLSESGVLDARNREKYRRRCRGSSQ